MPTLHVCEGRGIVEGSVRIGRRPVLEVDPRVRSGEIHRRHPGRGKVARIRAERSKRPIDRLRRDTRGTGLPSKVTVRSALAVVPWRTADAN